MVNIQPFRANKPNTPKLLKKLRKMTINSLNPSLATSELAALFNPNAI